MNDDKQKPQITNTTRAANHPVDGPRMLFGGSGEIERMETRGQQELVASELLPAEIGYRDSERPAFEALGFVFGAPVDGDEIFLHATMPPGWTRRVDRTSQFWSYLCDEKGRKRVRVFYKAAFYDRRASMVLIPRYESRDLSWSEDGVETGIEGYGVIDNATGAFVCRSELPRGEEMLDPNYAVTSKWLDMLEPPARDPSHWKGV